MSDTPRTDSARVSLAKLADNPALFGHIAPLDFARHLERELNAALMMCEQNRVLAAQNQAIADNHLTMLRKEHEDFLDMRAMYQARIAELNDTIDDLRMSITGDSE